MAESSKVSTKTIADFERGQRVPYDRTLADVQSALERAGVEFTNGGQPGVRLSERKALLAAAATYVKEHSEGRSLNETNAPYGLKEAEMWLRDEAQTLSKVASAKELEESLYTLKCRGMVLPDKMMERLSELFK